MRSPMEVLSLLENPVAHQMAASTRSQIDLTSSSFKRLHLTISRFAGFLSPSPNISAALSKSRTTATTLGTSRFSNSWTAYFPSRPVAPTTATDVTTSLVGMGRSSPSDDAVLPELAATVDARNGSENDTTASEKSRMTANAMSGILRFLLMVIVI